MFVPSREMLETRSRLYRYFFYLLSSFRPVTITAWVNEGEPNPFVADPPRVRMTHQQEIQDIFKDSLGRR